MQKQGGSGCALGGLLVIFLVCMALLIHILVPSIMEARERQKVKRENEAGYQQAVELYRDGKYSEAYDLFRTLRYDYARVKEYMTLCDAHFHFNKDNMDMAHFVLGRYTFSFLTGEEREEFEAFQRAVNTGYEAEKARKEREARQEMENRIRTEAPFYGMPESRINDTILGAYSEKKISRYDRDKEAHVYYWYQGDKTLYYASCKEGSVTSIHDYRDHPKPPAGSGIDISPYPDVSFFSNPGDFYYFYVDDFDGYQDAEDFYYEHGGK